MPALQIRNVPPEVHATLKARAAAKGQSLSEYALGELRAVATRPSLAEVLARVDEEEPIHRPVDSASLVRERRDRS